MNNKRLVTNVAWGSALLGTAASLYVWGASLNWDMSKLNAYSLFPVLGLVAYSLMISHYLAGTVRVMNKQPKELLSAYFRSTSIVVLICILLHPALFIYQLWATGNGLPPASYKAYVASSLLIWVYVGIVSLMAFLLYELRTKFNTRSWWKYVQYASDIAMIGIFFHGLKLGQHLDAGWFQIVWYIYGLILVASLAFTYSKKLRA